MSRSAKFVQNAQVQGDKSGVSDSPESWVMPDSVMMHLFAQSRHIEARMSASTTMSEVSKMVASRSMQLNFQVALGCGVMIEWCWMRLESLRSDKSDSSGMSKSDQVVLSGYYDRLYHAWSAKYEVARKFYNAPVEVWMSEMDKIILPTDMPEVTVNAA